MTALKLVPGATFKTVQPSQMHTCAAYYQYQSQLPHPAEEYYRLDK